MAGNKTKKTNTDNKKADQTQKITQSSIFYEVAILVTIALCVLLFLANFGIIGVVGDAVSRFMFGVFGFLAYVVPLVVMPLIVFRLYVARSKQKSKRISKVKLDIYKNRRKKAFFVILGLICTAILGELIVNSYTPDTSFIDYFLNSRETGTGGGFVAGIFINILVPLIGLIGTYFVVAIILIICMIVISGKPIISLIGRESKKVYDKTKSYNQQEFYEDDEGEMRLAQKADGIIPPSKNVMTNIFGTKKKSKKADVVELIPETFEATKEVDGFGGLGENQVADGTKSRSLFTEIDLSNSEPQLNVATPNITIPGEVIDDKYTVIEPSLVKGSPTSVTPMELSPADIAPVELNPSEFLPGRSSKEGGASPDAINNESDIMQSNIGGKLKERKITNYRKPSLNLLSKGRKGGGDSEAHLLSTARRLEEILMNFGVHVKVINASRGPAVTRYELQPEQGVKVSKIVGLADDIKLNLAVSDLRIEAPIPGKAAVGIEVPNKENTPVLLRELLESQEFADSPSNLSFAVGKDIAGKVIVADIATMPHLLIAGATGAGKSVCINTIIMSLIYKADPDKVRLIMIDPKVVELSVYNGIPHLLYDVVTDPKKAAGALNWAVAEMSRRYQLFAEFSVRDLAGYNEKVEFINAENAKPEEPEESIDKDNIAAFEADYQESEKSKVVLNPLPQIVIIVDELADLMMIAPSEVEGAICRLAQLARAAGLHLIVATQRPSVNVITGLIKANMPSRIAFSVTSGVDSRTIIDMNGAEKLLGRGDMLFYPSGYPKPVRVQGSFVSDTEVHKIVDFLKKEANKVSETLDITIDSDSENIEDYLNGNATTEYPGSVTQATENEEQRDSYFAEAGFLIIDKEKASIGMLQRRFKIGFNRAARIMDQLHEAGFVSGEEGTRPRNILMSKEEFERYLEENGIE